MKKVAIIGGGIAGLACAQGLSANGATVIIFDKARGPGGRMSTRRATTSLGEVSFDHGAQYFTARDPAFVNLVEKLIEIGAVARWSGELVRLAADGSSKPLANEDLYVGTPGMNGVVKALGEGVHKMPVSSPTSEAQTLDPAVIAHNTDGVPAFAGMTPLIVNWSTRVGQVVRQSNRTWQLLSETGQDLGTYDQIVCAVPAEQVSPLLKPVAPELAQMGEATRSLPCWTGMFAFDGPLAMPFDAIRFDGHPLLDFIATNCSKPKRADIASYVVQANAYWSQQNLELDGEQVAQALLETLLSLSDNRPQVLHSATHRWRYARVDVAHGVGSVFDTGLGIGMCGDWLSGPRVESAWLSGHGLSAKMILASAHQGVA